MLDNVTIRDGDSFNVDGEEFRLEGVDAMESNTGLDSITQKVRLRNALENGKLEYIHTDSYGRKVVRLTDGTTGEDYANQEIAKGNISARPSYDTGNWYSLGSDNRDAKRAEERSTAFNENLFEQTTSGDMGSTDRYAIENMHTPLEAATKTAINNELGGFVERTWDRGTGVTQMTMANTARMLSEDVFGSEEYAQFFEEKVQDYARDVMARPEKYNFDSVDTPMELGGFIVERAIETLPGVGAILAGGGAGGAVSMAAGIGKKALPLLGAYAANFGQTTGETNLEFQDEGMDNGDTRATQYAAGGVKAGLDFFALMKTLDPNTIRTIVATQPEKLAESGITKLIAKDLAKKGLYEGSTEVLQTAIDKTAIKLHNPDYDALSEENKKQYIESFASGVAGSVGISVPTTAYGAARGAIDLGVNQAKDRLASTENEPTPTPTEPTEPTPTEPTEPTPTPTRFADVDENDPVNYALSESPIVDGITSRYKAEQQAEEGDFALTQTVAPEQKPTTPKRATTPEPPQTDERQGDLDFDAEQATIQQATAPQTNPATGDETDTTNYQPNNPGNSVITQFADAVQTKDIPGHAKLKLAITLADKLIADASKAKRKLTTVEEEFAITVGQAINAKQEDRAVAILNKFAVDFNNADDKAPRRESTMVGVEEKAPMQAVDTTEMTDAELDDAEYNPDAPLATEERGVDYNGVVYLGTQKSKGATYGRVSKPNKLELEDAELSVRETLTKKLEEVQAAYPQTKVSIVRAKQGGVNDKVWALKVEPETETAKQGLKANWGGTIVRAKQDAKKYGAPDRVSGIRVSKYDKKSKKHVEHTLSLQTLITNALNKAEVDDTKKDMQKYQAALGNVVTELMVRGYEFPSGKTSSAHDMIASALEAEAKSRPGIKDAKEAARNAVVYNSRGSKLTLQDINPKKQSKGVNNVTGDTSNSYKSALNPSPKSAEQRIAKLQAKIAEYDAVVSGTKLDRETKEKARIARQKALASIEFNKQFLKENDYGTKDRAEQKMGEGIGSEDQVVRDQLNATNEAAGSKVNEDQTSKKADKFQSDKRDVRKERNTYTTWYNNVSRSLANKKLAFIDTNEKKNESIATANAEEINNRNLDAAAEMFEGVPEKKRTEQVLELLKPVDMKPVTAEHKNLKMLGSFASDKSFVSYAAKLINTLGMNKKAIIYDEHTVEYAIKELGVAEDSALAKQMFTDVTPGNKEDHKKFYAGKDNFARIYYHGDKYAVVIHSAMPKNKAMFALAHEFGHAYLESTRDSLLGNRVIAERLRKQWKHHLGKSAMNQRDYSFNEWFADQVALSMMGLAINKKGIVGRRLKELSTRIKNALTYTVDNAVTQHMSDAGEITQAGIQTLDKFTSDSYFAQLMDNILSGKEHVAHNAKFGEHLRFDSMDGASKRDILNGKLPIPEFMSKETFNERLSGYVANVRRFFADQQYREQAVDKAIVFIDKVTAGGHTPLAKIWADGDSRMRNIGEPGSEANKAAQKIADILFTPVERKEKPGFSNSVFAEMGMWLHHYSNAFDVKKLSRQEMREVTQFLLSEKETRDAPAKYRTTIAEFRRVHEDFYKQVVSHIRDVDKLTPGGRKNHFPRLWDHTKVGANREKLIDLIEHYAQINNVTDVNAAQSVDFIIALGNNPALEEIDANPTTSNANARSLWFVPNAAVMDLVVDEPDAVLNNYVQQMLKKYEWQSRVSSTDKHGNFLPRGRMDALIEQLPTDKDKEYAEDYIKAHLGQLRADMNPELKGAMALMMALFNVAKLPLSTLSSLMETALIGVRLKDTKMKGVLGVLRDTEIKSALNRARAWGFTEERMLQQVVNSVYGSPASGTFTGKTADKLNGLLFKYNGQQFLTSFNRAIASTLGEEFLVTHAKAAKEGDTKSRSYIEELIGTGKKTDFAIDAIINWHQSGRPTPQSSDIFRTKSKKEKVADAVLVQHMLSRFVDEAVLRPNAGHRPIWGSDPLWALVSHLKQYFWAAHKTILPQLITALKTTELKNLDAAMPLFYFGILAMGLSAFGLEVRDELKQLAVGKADMTENMSNTEYAAEVFFRANGLFALEPINSAMDVAGWSDVAPYGFVEGFVPTLAYTGDLLSGDIGSVMPIYGVF